MGWRVLIAGGLALTGVPRLPLVEISYVANMGVLIRGATGSVMIDGLHQRYGPAYLPTPDSVVAQVNRSVRPYDHLSALLVTHYHRDHFSAELVRGFLKASATKRVAGAPQVIDSLPPAQTINAWNQNRLVLADSGAGITIQAFDLPHTWPRRHARVQNIGYLVTIDGIRILHVGDADVDPEVFGRVTFGQIDVAIVPSWFIDGSGRSRIVTDQIRPARVIVTHLEPGAAPESAEGWVARIPVNRFTLPGQRVAVPSRSVWRVPSPLRLSICSTWLTRPPLHRGV